MPTQFRVKGNKKSNDTLMLWRDWLVSFVYKDGQYLLRFRYWIKSIPFLNFFWDLFFREDSPSYESAKSLLDVLGLINALMLATSAGLLGAINYDDLIEADKRWVPEKYDQENTDATMYHVYWSKYYVMSPSNQLYFDFANSLTLFFVGIVIVVYIYCDMLTKTKTFGEIDLKSKLEKSDKEEWSEFQLMEVFVSWYKYARFAFLAVVGTTVGGCTYAVLSVNVMFAVKYPDYYLATYGQLVNKNSCPTGYTYYSSITIFISFGLMAVTACGMGTSNKHFILEQIRKEKEARQRFEKVESKKEEERVKGDNKYKQVSDNRIYPTEDARQRC